MTPGGCGELSRRPLPAGGHTRVPGHGPQSGLGWVSLGLCVSLGPLPPSTSLGWTWPLIPEPSGPPVQYLYLCGHRPGAPVARLLFPQVAAGLAALVCTRPSLVHLLTSDPRQPPSQGPHPWPPALGHSCCRGEMSAAAAADSVT